MLKLILVWLAALALVACGGGGGGGGGAPSANSPPTITSAATATVLENRTGAFYFASATDPDNDPITFSVSGGADAARFSITPAGALSFTAPPDFDAPADADRNNVYEVVIAAFDGGASTSRALRITVTDAAGAVAVRRVATGLTQPLFLTGKRDGSERVFVVEKPGRIRILNPATGAIAAQAFLDVSGEVNTDGERGLLGLALAPDWETSGRFYVHLTNAAGDIEIRRYLRASGDAANPSSGDVILRVPHARTNHNGGWLGFGQDGLLYIAMGDGGTGGAFAQDRNSLLGKILRIDPRSDAFPTDAERDYAIPSGNPFASGGGAPEVWVYGLRNPFRAAFAPNGDLIVGDVGEGAWEEIDLVRAGDGGRNYGWPILEATHAFSSGSTAGLTPPVLEYPHGTGPSQGSSVTGGYVYRGPVVALRGEYIFGDYVSHRIFSAPAGAFQQGSTLTTLTDRTSAFTPDLGAIGGITSFGEDDAGNLYIVDIDGEIFVLRAIE